MGKFFGYALLASIIGTIVFVRAGQLGGKSGGEQASDVINSTLKGAATLLNAGQGYKV